MGPRSVKADKSSKPIEQKEIEVLARVPTQQYGFIEFRGSRSQLKEIESLYNQYAENKVSFGQGSFMEIETFTGEKVRYNAETHVYTDMDGNKLVSGSEFARSKEKPFDSAMISKVVGKKYDVSPNIIADMWSKSGSLSASFGTCLHSAMENWFRYREYGTEKEYHLPKPAYLRRAVETFPLKDADIIPEIMVSDVKNGMVGQIDGLYVIDKEKKIARIIDYKSDSDVMKNLDKHCLQLNFYRWILEAHGWTIQGLDIYNYVDSWAGYELALKEK